MGFYTKHKEIKQRYSQDMTNLWANATDEDLEDYVWGLIGDEPCHVGGTFKEELESAKKGREHYQRSLTASNSNNQQTS